MATNENLPAGGEREAGDGAPFVPGKLVILAVLALSIGAGAVSWFYFAWLQRRPLELWGSEAAALMMRAPTARSYRLEPAPDNVGAAESAGRVFEIAGERFVAADERDISRAPGFSHIRQSFVHNASFAWDAPAEDRPPKWQYAIEFEDQGRRAALVFDFRCTRIALAGSDRTASIRPVAAEIESFLKEQY